MTTERWEHIQVNGQTMGAFTARPEAGVRLPAVVVAQHGYGVDAFVQEMTRRVAAAGYLGIAPDLYHHHGPDASEDVRARVARLRDAEVIADVNATVAFLQRQDTVLADRIGIMGFCMGGRVVYLMAAVNPAFRAAIPFYGGGTMAPWGEGLSPFDRLGDIGCPLLGFFGGKDTNPSPQDREKLDAELTRRGKSHQFHVYEGAGHGYMDFTNPSRYHADAAQGSWPSVVEFLSRHLQQGSSS